MGFFNQNSYPHHWPEGQQLLLAMSQLYPSGKAALYMAQKSGLNTGVLYTDQAPTLAWIEVLGRAYIEGKARILVEQVRDEFPRSSWRPFLDSLITGAAATLDLEERVGNGAPLFLHANDEVTEPETLLFHDDLTLPAAQLPQLIEALQRVAALIPAVCRLEIRCRAGMGSGTGFRIGPDRILTNWHVLWPQGETALSATATFGYEDDTAGVGLAGVALGCDISTIAGNAEDDWAVVSIAGMPDHVPIILLNADSAARMHGRAFVIQHPGGQRKRIAYTRNTITFCDERVVQYLSDTRGGSSGAPVIDEYGQVIALHRAGGRPQEVMGQPPLKKNEGVAIQRVIAGLAQLSH